MLGTVFTTQHRTLEATSPERRLNQLQKALYSRLTLRDDRSETFSRRAAFRFWIIYEFGKTKEVECELGSLEQSGSRLKVAYPFGAKGKRSSNPVKIRLENQNIHLPLAYHRAPLPLSLVTVHRNAEKRRCTAGGK